MERKATFIAQLMRGKLDTREIDEIDSSALGLKWAPRHAARDYGNIGRISGFDIHVTTHPISANWMSRYLWTARPAAQWPCPETPSWTVESASSRTSGTA